ncbi:T9SS C-terminal target domain-containing protein [Hanamia caeni]|uniref:T9SS C-terminal target domain-containing protein n=1 Tax=Hanamia caeni TaxID=2294116 RepID=A0A3M9NPR6_9BACT|nr:T9SS type A sorting domain-containing protein [Hanamia caeni]RNI39028.1 T9SS C-terminal target domain-containing protein [Hanamia caeni]
MKTNFPKLYCTIVSIFSFLIVHTETYGQADVIMNHNDLKRTGWNNRETILATDNVSGGNFGKIFSRDVDDEIYAQPLVLSNLPIAGGVHNVVFVATVNNTLYAFDADDASATAPYWQVDLTYDPANYRPVNKADMTGACGGNYADFSGNMGIVGTPAIDTATNTLYVVARSKSKTSADYVQYLHAIDVKTGAEKCGGPVLITATVAGTGDGSVGGYITFNAQTQNQRPGLLLYNNTVYISWASHCDWYPYHGWIMGYSATNLHQKYVYNATPEGGLAGIWMSGQPPSVDDDGNLYVTTGNGTTGLGGNPNDTTNRGSSLLKLSPELKVLDFFTPSNYEYLNDADRDYGINGALLVPGTNLSLSGSKDGGLYVIDNTQMGGFKADNSNVIQRLNFGDAGTSNTRHLYGSPVYYKDIYNNEYIYGWAERGFLQQIPFNRTEMKFDTLNTKYGITMLPATYMPGGILSLSSNGSKPGTGILWVNRTLTGNPNQMVVPGALQAYDAMDITHELWNSNWNNKRDSVGKHPKFVPPTIANGKVYMATFSNKLNVYGLNPPPASECAATLPPMWQSADIGYVAFAGDVCVDNGTFSITASGDDIGNNADAFHYLFQPVITNETELTIKINSIKNTDPFAKCGIMFRQNLDPGSAFVMVSLVPSGYIFIKQRTAQNIGVTDFGNWANEGAPCWIRVYNKGNKYVFSYSLNGADWTKLDSLTLALGTNPYVGIAYTTKNNSVLDTAVVENVALQISGILDSNLLTFTGKNQNNKSAILSWITANDANNDYFEIQKSKGNTDFQTIGTVKANGIHSQSKDYSFIDYLPEDGNNYYRLKQVDKSGQISYSSVVMVRFNLKTIIIYPNPAYDKIYIRNNDNFSNGNKIIARILDLSGKLIFKKEFETYGVDVNTLNIPKRIAEGMYVLMITNNKGEQQIEKIYINR